MSSHWKRVVKDLTGRGAPEVKGQAYGIEVELEDVVRGEYPDGWMTHHDGSLRNNGVEFITPPVSREDAETLIRRLWRAKELNGWTGGDRCGVHIHMDMSSRTIRELHAFMLAYACLEPLFFSLCGGDREQNIFCVPWYRAPRELEVMRNLVYHPVRSTAAVTRNVAKYTSMNIGPLTRFNTLEFRGAPVYEQPEAMLHLLDAFGQVLGATRKVVDSEAIVDEFDDNPEQAVLKYAPLLADRWRLVDDDAMAAALRLVRTKPGNDWSFIGVNPEFDPAQEVPPPEARVPPPRGGVRIDEAVGLHFDGMRLEIADEAPRVRVRRR